MSLRYLSVCSGIEAATVAWHPLGFRALAFSEIDPFARAVLAHHYPDVPLHGDFTVLREEEWIAAADILVGGTPCQGFSIAGLRRSLEDARGNLTLQAGAQHGITTYAFQPRIGRNGRGDMGEIVNALNAQSGETGKGDAAPCVAVTDTHGVGSNQTTGFESEIVAANLSVRRLLPEECEALQGFPRRYTRIPWRNKSADDCPDGLRYKALGNSMAVNVMRWIGQRIKASVSLADEPGPDP